MTSMIFALILKPLALIAFLLPGAIAAFWIKHRMPECKLKRLLLISWRV